MVELIQDILASQLGISVLLSIVLIAVIMLLVMVSIYFERKISGWIQDRFGPNRVGPRGVLQPVADGLKFFLKEDITPASADKPLFVAAPLISFVVAMVTVAAVPWGGALLWPWAAEPVLIQVGSLDIGLLYILAVGSMGAYGVLLAGWASNNKYSFFGGLRAAAQMLSYEVPMGLAILAIVLTTGSLRLEQMVSAQIDTTWNVLLHPLAFFLLLVSILAEMNRAPFDLPECEQELVGGYHTEYSSMKFALFFMGEYAHMAVAGSLMAVMFLGGWQLVPFGGWLAEHVSWLGWLGWIDQSQSWLAVIVRMAVMLAKVCGFIFVCMWIRWTLPRFRFDQLMRLTWRGLVPMGLALVVGAGVLVYMGRAVSWWAPAVDVVIVVAALLLSPVLGSPVTGRQADLPDIRVRGARDVGRVAAGGGVR